MKFFKQRRLNKLNEELNNLKNDFKRIDNDMKGIAQLIEDPNFQNHIQIHCKIFSNLTNNLFENKLKQDKILRKLSKLEN